jgi:glycerophosphoryl diester phosphodiesterase
MTDPTRRVLVPPVAALAVLAAAVPAHGEGLATDAPRRAIEIHGHRGARAVRPENTMAAFACAAAVGADVLEMDVVVTRDGVPVVHHDLELDPLKCRMRDGRPAPAGRALRSMTLAEVRALDCGATPHPDFPRQVAVPGAGIPTLAEVLRWTAGRPVDAAGPLRLNIEAKSLPDRPDLAPDPATFARLLVDAIRAAGLVDRATLQSFDHRILPEVARLEPRLGRAALIADLPPDPVAAARAAGATVLSPRFDALAPEHVRAAHAAGLRVVPWTVNEPAAWARAIEAGVDGIITDDPEGLRAFLAAAGHPVRPLPR